MKPSAGNREELIRLFIVAVASVSAIAGTIISLSQGVFSVFPFLYILPIICVVYFYPRRAVFFALGISIIYIGLVYLLGEFDPVLVAVSTAWFAIFITLAVVVSSYANGLQEEKARIRYIMENTVDGIFCFDPVTLSIRRVNQKCAQWLLYAREDLEGRPVALVLTDNDAIRRITGSGKEKKSGEASEFLFRQKTGGMLRFLITPLYVTKDAVLCSVVNITDITVADEEIRQTLEDLERQVKERTSHLERINEELRAEILKHRKIEQTLLSGETKKAMDREGEDAP